MENERVRLEVDALAKEGKVRALESPLPLRKTQADSVPCILQLPAIGEGVRDSESVRPVHRLAERQRGDQQVGTAAHTHTLPSRCTLSLSSPHTTIAP